MPTFVVLLLVFTVIPVCELALLLRLGRALGVAPTVGLVLLTGVVGAALARRQGITVLRRMQAEMAAGRVPTDALLDGAMILLAGALLVTPGVITDCVGVTLLIPPLRRLYRGLLRRWAAGRFVVHGGGPGPGMPFPGFGQGPPPGWPGPPGPAGDVKVVEAEVRDVERGRDEAPAAGDRTLPGSP